MFDGLCMSSICICKYIVHKSKLQCVSTGDPCWPRPPENAAQVWRKPRPDSGCGLLMTLLLQLFMDRSVARCLMAGSAYWPSRLLSGWYKYSTSIHLFICLYRDLNIYLLFLKTYLFIDGFHFESTCKCFLIGTSHFLCKEISYCG